MTTNSQQHGFSLCELPIAINSPYLSIDAPPLMNSPIDLYSGSMELRLETTTINGFGKVRMDWFPRPNIYFEFSFPGFWEQAYIGLAQLFLTNMNIGVDVLLTWFRMGGTGSLVGDIVPKETIQQHTVINGMVRPTAIGTADRIVSLKFLLPNFFARGGKISIRNVNSTRAWGGRLQYAFGKWEITIDRITECNGDFFQFLDETGGYAITHIGMLRKYDDSEFSVAEAVSTLDAMNLLLSFCNGRRTGIILPVGFDITGNKAWELWRVPDIARACAVFTWVPDQGLSWIESFEKVFSKFADCWQKLDNIDTLRSAIDWYVEANSSQTEHEKESIIMTQTALELLAWAELVENHKKFNPSGFERKQAVDKLRLLIDLSKTPLEIPKGYTNLQQGCLTPGKSLWADGPEAFVSIRNSIIHAGKKAKRKLRNNPSWPAWLAEAKQIGLWYLERSILHFIGFEGWYFARGVIAPNYGPVEQWFPFGLPEGCRWESDVETGNKSTSSGT